MMRRIKKVFLPAKTEETMIREELQMMLPGMIAEQVAAVLLDNINVIVMGFIGRAALAGVSQISTVNNTLMIVFQSFALGGTALAARCAGAKKKEEASRVAGSALALGTGLGILVTLLLFAFRGQVVRLLFGAAEKDVIENSLRYFRWTLFAPPLWFLYFQCCGFMRSSGDTKRPMFVSIFINILSMALNLILTFGMKMGVTGSALSYVLSVLGGAMLALFLVFQKSFYMRPKLCAEGKLFLRIKEISGIGLPSAVENFAFNGTKLVVQVFIAGMGTVVISANQVFNSASGLLMIPFLSVNALTMPLLGRCIGRGNKKTIRRGLLYLYEEARFAAIWTGAAHLLLAFPAAYLFSRDLQVLPAAVQMIMIYGLFALFMPGCFILPNGFKAAGDARYPMVYSSLSAWIIRVIGMWILGVKLGWGIYAIVITQGVDHISRCLAYRRRFAGDKWLLQVKKAE